MYPATGRSRPTEERVLEIKLTLATKGNPAKLKGLDSTVGVITDHNNNVLCLVPLERMEWVFDCIARKSKTDRLFSRLIKQGTVLCAQCKVKSDSWDDKTDADIIAYRKKGGRQGKQDRFAV